MLEGKEEGRKEAWVVDNGKTHMECRTSSSSSASLASSLGITYIHTHFNMIPVTRPIIS